MDRKAVKGEAEENRVSKQVESVESEENKAPNLADKREEESPESAGAADQNGAVQEEEKVATSARQPFTTLSQVDQDMALARALQEQERAYHFLRLGGEDSSEFDSSGSGTYDYDDYFEYEEDDGVDGSGDEQYEDHDEDAEGEAQEEEETEGEGGNLAQLVHGWRELDGSEFADDEAYARALQDQEDRETTAMMAMAGIHDVDEYSESDGSQEDWEDVDPDNMSYEELVALGEAVGVHNRGLASDVIASLPSSSYVANQDANSSSDEQCVICRLEYEAGDAMVELPCKHRYHSECIQPWLRINKVCPICSAEVSTPVDGTNSLPASPSSETL